MFPALEAMMARLVFIFLAVCRRTFMFGLRTPGNVDQIFKPHFITPRWAMQIIVLPLLMSISRNPPHHSPPNSSIPPEELPTILSPRMYKVEHPLIRLIGDAVL